jgi:hypothetical protein
MSAISFQVEGRAPIENLSPIKRKALAICLEGDGMLHKCSGAWMSASTRSRQERIHGTTVADLTRDGFLIITVGNKQASARLTARGIWFARTAAQDLAATGTL